MPTILPNWHPITVHFAIALLIVSTVLTLAASLGRQQSWANAAATVARWNLALGVLAALAALATGWNAYNTVTHDDPSHANITVHLKWAFAAAGGYLIVALLAFFDRRRSAGMNAAVAIVSMISAGLLAVTGWYGGENVYRYGLGVAALPDQGQHHHDGMVMPKAADHAHGHDD